MTTFDDRENAFENKFAHDQEMSFRITARRNKLVGQWAAAKMGLTCKHQEGAEQDVISFERSGVNGTMTVTANSFDVNIKLGLMMKAFKPMIEAEIAKNVSRMVEKASGTQA